jgi:hypothetical protein
LDHRDLGRERVQQERSIRLHRRDIGNRGLREYRSAGFSQCQGNKVTSALRRPDDIRACDRAAIPLTTHLQLIPSADLFSASSR